MVATWPLSINGPASPSATGMPEAIGSTVSRNGAASARIRLSPGLARLLSGRGARRVQLHAPQLLPELQRATDDSVAVAASFGRLEAPKLIDESAYCHLTLIFPAFSPDFTRESGHSSARERAEFGGEPMKPLFSLAKYNSAHCLRLPGFD